MDLELTEEQRALAESVRRFCCERITPERLRAWEELPEGVDGATWAEIASLGWFGLGAPPPAGSGGSLEDVALLLQECARGLVPRAVIHQIRMVYALAQLGLPADELAPVAAGESRVALALDEADCRDPARWRTRVTGSSRSGDGAVIGEKSYVTGAACAAAHLVGARDAGGRPGLFLVNPVNTELQALRAFDGEVQHVVRYRRAPVRRALAAGEGAMARIDALVRRQRALALAEMVGGMEAVLEMTVAYVKEREQFGRKIGAFQAVQHQVADMATARTAARHLTWRAICRIDAGTEEGEELEHAAAFTGQWFKRITLTAHHLHGGAGYVLEHPLHYHAERAQALCIRYTPEGPALARIASALLRDTSEAPDGRFTAGDSDRGGCDR